MNQSPYAALKSESEGVVEPITRKRWVAVILGLVVPPVAMLYVARPLRAVVYLAVLIFSIPIGVLLGAHGISDPVVFAGVIRVMASLAAAIDGYRLAKIWKGATLPWYSRAPALAGFTLVQCPSNNWSIIQALLC